MTKGLPMRIALGQTNQLTPEIIQFAHQLGIHDIQFNMFHGSPHLPGEQRSLSFVCWARIDSLDRQYNSLFLTDGHEIGEPHWQIMRDGRLFFSVKKREPQGKNRPDKHIYFSPPIWNPTLSGRWMQICTTYDVDAKIVTHYIDGKEISREAIPDEYLVEHVKIEDERIF